MEEIDKNEIRGLSPRLIGKTINKAHNASDAIDKIAGLQSSASEIDKVVSLFAPISRLATINNATIEAFIAANDNVLFDIDVVIDDSILLSGLANKKIAMMKHVSISIPRHGYAGIILDTCSNIDLEYVTLKGYGNFPDRINPFGTPLVSPNRGMGEKGIYPNYNDYRNGDVASGGVEYGNGLAGTRGDGIVLINCNNISIYSPDISGFNGAGIQVGDNTTPYSGQTHNRDIKIGQGLICDCYTSGIFINFGKNVIISANSIKRIGHPDSSASDDIANPGYGIGVGTWGSGSSPSRDITITSNSIVDAKRKSLDFHGGEIMTAQSNVCSGSLNAGASLAGSTAGYPKNVTLLGNTFTDCGSTDFPTEEAYGIQSTGDNCVATGNIVINASTPFYINGDKNAFNSNTAKYTAEYSPKSTNKSALVIRNAKECSFNNNTISMIGASTMNTYMIQQFSTSQENEVTLNVLGNTYTKGNASGENNIISNNDSNGGIGRVRIADIILDDDIRVENTGDKKLRNNIFETKAYLTILASNGGLSFETDALQGSGSIDTITNTNSTTTYVTLKNSDAGRVESMITNFKTSDYSISRVDIGFQNSSTLGIKIIDNNGVVLNTTSLTADITIELSILHDRYYK